MNPRFLSALAQDGLIAASSALLSFLTRFYPAWNLPVAVLLGVAIAASLLACFWKEEREIETSSLFGSGTQRVSRYLLSGTTRLRIMLGLAFLVLGLLLGRL
ncbi:hypothetical protein H6F43_00915 [Leptolyngbya sp. FACHB-36]|uniref:hypothetical protein n=1 Tax=Leptolyngbya sp. FACHB-36 TaxID=2692808 RepID=UPI00167FEA50|nr:hypothetical protein [Leptolyngbya sp. FACHB-36]MBD2018743.1 hypothetical protein [Leptolyngbya sp. FACHB-36]